MIHVYVCSLSISAQRGVNTKATAVIFTSGCIRLVVHRICKGFSFINPRLKDIPSTLYQPAEALVPDVAINESVIVSLRQFCAAL